MASGPGTATNPLPNAITQAARVRWAATALASIALLFGLACGEHQGPGEVTAKPASPERVAARAQRQGQAAALLDDLEAPRKQILFGDLHVHTTFSTDAFAIALPMLGGEGAHPPADACDFARFCADLDFWSLNDHAEGLTPAHWQESIESVRACNAAAGDAEAPDVVAYLGWEWTQVGNTPETHYGHHNVVLRELAEGRVPTRPIHAIRPEFTRFELPFMARLAPLADWPNRQIYWDQQEMIAEINDTPRCAEGVPVRDLPDDCMEGARTPGDLNAKLDDWGFDALVIPHGTTWGFTSPAGASLDLGMNAVDFDPERQRLFEIYSGHGNAEEYRSWRSVVRDAEGELFCPAPTADYVPCCWRAGEIIRHRCEPDVDAEVCEARVEAARRNYVAAGPAGFQTVPGARAEDWLECSQCTDCFLPANGHVPTMSAQYGLARVSFDDPDAKIERRAGFIGSSDTHRARAGNGFKEFGLRRNADATLTPSSLMGTGDPEPESRALDYATLPLQKRRDTERQASMYVTGGLVAVHAPARQRDAIFASLHRREAYATSGDRILLWFDLLNAPSGDAPMGSEVAMVDPPRFRVAAMGAFEQKPGCPPDTKAALGADRLERLCLGECYHPGDMRKPITRIEVVRVRPQLVPDEPIETLIDDPWRTYACPAEGAGCRIEFEDPDWPSLGRSAAYYVRAIQIPSPAVNGAGLGCLRRDAEGRCVAVEACGSSAPDGEDCLADVEERAWSSPIWIDPAPGAGPSTAQ